MNSISIRKRGFCPNKENNSKTIVARYTKKIEDDIDL